MEDILDMWVVPTPFINYIEGFRDAFNISQINIYVSGSSISAKYAFESIKYEIKLTYTPEGIAEFIEYVDEDGTSFVRIALNRELNTTLLLIIIIASVAGLIGILVIVWKKRSNPHS